MEDIRIDGLTADEWEELANPQAASNEQLEELGIMQASPQAQQTEETPNNEQPSAPLNTEREYEDLDYWQTVGDEWLAIGTEASRFFLPKSKELNYTPRTKAGEFMKKGTRVALGITGLLYGGEVAGGLKLLAQSKNLTSAAKAAGGVEKILKGNKFFKTSQGGAKAFGVKALNIGTQGVLQGAILDSYIPEDYEGRLADMLGDTNNKFIDWLQTDENDSVAEDKLKNIVEGAVLSVGLNGAFEAAAPILGRVFKNAKNLRKPDITPEETANIVDDITQNQVKLQKIADTSELADTVKAIREEALEAGDDASQMLVDRLNPQDIENAQRMLNIIDEGEDIFIHSDGTFDIKVSNWEDAYKVSKDEYGKQLSAQDIANNAEFAGDTAITQQDDAIRTTWTNRGWIGENEELTPKISNKIAKNYKDKWQIDNNIKVEFVDGLTLKGEAVEGNTNATTFLGKKSKKGTLPNITIQIDKNARNPYATLRAELEHARDIAKGEIPDQNIQHFSRYSGLNEGEAAVDYTYKKSVGRSNILNQPKNTFDSWYENKQAESTIGDLINDEAFKSEGLLDDVADIKVKHTNSDNLPMDTPLNDTHTLGGYVTIENGEPVIYTNSNLSKELVEENLYHELQHARDIKTAYLNPNASLEERMTAYQDIQEVMNAVSSGDVEAYKNSKYEVKADLNRDFLKNKKKEYYDRQQTTTLTGGSPDNNEVRFSHEGNAEAPDGNRGLRQGSSSPEGVGNTSTDIQGTVGQSPYAEQLKLDFDNKINSAVSMESLTDGSLVVNSVEDIDKTINKTIELSPEISGTTWEAITKDSEAQANLMIQAEELGLTNDLVEAISMNDVAKMDSITRTVLAVQKLSSHLTDKLDSLGENPPFEQMSAIIDLIDQIGRYTKETGSASGRSLQARKLINKGVQTFGSLRLSQLTKEGIESLSDILSVDIKNICDLNFTRGTKLTPQQMKSELMGKWLQNTDSPFVQMLINDTEIAAKFDDILTKAIKNNGNINLNSELVKAVTEVDYKRVYNATQLTDNKENKFKVLKNWIDSQGGLTSYYVHNLLSGVGTLAKNLISGSLNTLYFPAKKIVAGYMGGGDSMVREGINTYKQLTANWAESWNLCKQAFLKGDGKLSVMRDTMNMSEDEVLEGFREWNFDFDTPEGIWHAIQNFHSVMTRAMGASDEFMSQLNYRSIKRARAIEQANELAKQYGIEDETIKDAISDRIFREAFDSAGRPMDTEVLAEAKDILYQLPLNGQIFDRATGEMKQVRPETWATKAGQAINNAANSNFFLKIMFPFVKTGINILQQNLEHNGIYGLLSNSQRKLLLSNTREGALARSQAAFGMFSFMGAASLAMSGRITGSAPSDPNERKALFATGWKPYSIRVGGKFYSYQGYEPIQTILGFAADSVNIYGNIVNSEDDAKWQKFSQRILSTVMNNFLDKAAFRTGIKQLAFLTSPDENYADFAKAMQQTAQGFLPDAALIRNISSVGERAVTVPQGYERIFSNYFNRGLGDYRRDVFGNRQDNYGLIVTNAGKDNSDLPEYAELEYLAQYGFNPSEITQTITGTTLKYRDFKSVVTGRSIYDTMQEELSIMTIDGKTLQEAVRDLVTSEEYQMLPIGVNLNGYKFSRSEETRLNAIRDIFVEYNNEALQNVIRDYGDEFVDKKHRTINEAVEEVNLEKINSSVNQGLDHNIANQLASF